jgi:broad specificity phosphatase PhoE
MQITLIRHLPTDWNVNTWLKGRKDIDLLPITDGDQHEVVTNQQILSRLQPFDIILASTLKRTHQTAQLYGMNVGTEPLLDELDFGKFEGRPKEDMVKELGESWLENPRELKLGENLVDLENRIVKFIKKYEGYKNILVFGHGSWIRAFISLIQNGHINRMNQIHVPNNKCITKSFDVNQLIKIIKKEDPIT